jgi:hypothetical protein
MVVMSASKSASASALPDIRSFQASFPDHTLESPHFRFSSFDASEVSRAYAALAKFPRDRQLLRPKCLGVGKRPLRFLLLGGLLVSKGALSPNSPLGLSTSSTRSRHFAKQSSRSGANPENSERAAFGSTREEQNPLEILNCLPVRVLHHVRVCIENRVHARVPELLLSNLGRNT